MVSSISFNGTYKVDNVQNNNAAFYRFKDYAQDKEYEGSAVTDSKDKLIVKEGSQDIDFQAEQTLIVPDYMDYDVETFCANNGIKYTKHKTQDLLKPASIALRIADAPNGYRKVNVNSEKLEELIQGQISNIDYCEEQYDDYFQKSVDDMLKSGDKFPATTLYIRAQNGNDDLRRFINRYGVENLNNRQISADFGQRTSKPDHCLYFALRDLGFEKVPVYVDNEAYEAGSILGLFN